MIGAGLIAMTLAAQPKPKPVEVLCVRNGLVLLNTFATNFKYYGPEHFSFYDVLAKKQRVVMAPCFKYENGTWEDSKFRPSK